KCRENFSVLVCRSGAEASGNAPHSCSGFSLKKVRISFRIRSQPSTYFEQSVCVENHILEHKDVIYQDVFCFTFYSNYARIDI
ncbi:MAG: hypothetical protein PHH83_04555, partial [Patescibacteria group bacterium]|nr:hypothetical protein [Patescibacteria group bacterium]